MKREEHEVAVARAVLAERERWECAIRTQANACFARLFGCADGYLMLEVAEHAAAEANALQMVATYGGRGNADLVAEMLLLGQWCDAASDAIDEERRNRARAQARRRR